MKAAVKEDLCESQGGERRGCRVGGGTCRICVWLLGAILSSIQG